MTPERLDELDIPLMVSQNSSRFETAFCVSIEAKRERQRASRLPTAQRRCLRQLIPRQSPQIWFAPATCSHYAPGRREF